MSREFLREMSDELQRQRRVLIAEFSKTIETFTP